MSNESADLGSMVLFVGTFIGGSYYIFLEYSLLYAVLASPLVALGSIVSTVLVSLLLLLCSVIIIGLAAIPLLLLYAGFVTIAKSMTYITERE